MLFKKTAVRRAARNVMGARAKRRITLDDVLRYELDDPRQRGELLDLLSRGYLLPELEGATTPTNSVLANPIYAPVALFVTSDQTVNQGDMVRWDGVNFTLKPLTDPTQVAFIQGGNYGYAGVAQGTGNPNVYPAPAAGSPSEALPGVVVQRGGTVRLKSITGEGSYFPFEPVTVSQTGQTGADAQTVTRLAQTAANRVGYVIVHPPANASAAPGATPTPEASSLSGGGVEVWVEPKFPGTYLL